MLTPVLEYLGLGGAGLLQRGLYGLQQQCFIDRFGQELENTHLGSGNGLWNGALGRHDDDREPGIKVPDLCEQVKAAGAFHSQVGKYQIDGVIAQHLQGFFGGGCGQQLEALGLESDHQQFQQAGVVVHQQQAILHLPIPPCACLWSLPRQ